MPDDYLVRVGSGFICNSSGKRRVAIVTKDVRRARKFNKEDALTFAMYATTALPDAIIFVARATNPEKEVNFDRPEEFVIAIGRRYLKAFKNGQIQITFGVTDAMRYSALDAGEVCELVRSAAPHMTVYVAHEESPFIPLSDCEQSGTDETNGS